MLRKKNPVCKPDSIVIRRHKVHLPSLQRFNLLVELIWSETLLPDRHWDKESSDESLHETI